MPATIVGSQTLSGSGAGTDNVSLVTTAPIPAGRLALLSFAYFSDNNDAIVNSITGGGLFWTVDRSHINAARTNKRTSIASASAVSGLPSGTTLTMTWDHPDVWAMLRVYYMDELPSGAFPTGGNSGASNLDADLPWDLGTISVSQPSVLVGTVWTDFVQANSSPTNGSSEAWEYLDPSFNWSLATNYKAVSSDNSVSGLWSAPGQGWQGTSVAYALPSEASGRDVYEGSSGVLGGQPDVFYGPQDIL